MLKEIEYFYALKVATNNTYIYNKSTLHRVTYVVYTCALMYLDRCSIRVRGKIYSRILLRESYRHQGKVKHRTVANLSNCSTQEIQAIELALKHKHDLSKLTTEASAPPSSGPDNKQPSDTQIILRQGLSIGAVVVLESLARELGIAQALGTDRQGRLALWQVIARAIDQGSRLSAVRLATIHACCDLLGLDGFNEEDLYSNLAWLTDQQRHIETRLFEALHPGENKPALFLYDVTSSYLEGTKNQLGAFGYNRDGKRGKMQIVIGLLCDEDGTPVSIEVFAGNMSDPKTVCSQIKKVMTQFGGGEVTFVGDRGMLKSAQMEQLVEQSFHYITAITKPQIEVLLKAGVFQMELFDEKLAEVIEEAVRYVVRRNPKRAAELDATRADKLRRVEQKVRECNNYLSAHPKASVQTAIKTLTKEVERLKLAAWVGVKCTEARLLTLEIDEQARNEEAKLDGCYVLKTDLKAEQASKEVVHDRYRDLALVEQAFRTSKTVELEMRPIHVRREASTRGHALVVMLAYRLVQELAQRWREVDLTVQEGLQNLSNLCAVEVVVAGQSACMRIPEPSADVARLIELAAVTLPKILCSRGAKVATKKKLPENRTKR
jgi:DDE family transposase